MFRCSFVEKKVSPGALLFEDLNISESMKKSEVF